MEDRVWRNLPWVHVIRPKPPCYPSQTCMLSVPNLHVIRPKPPCYPSQTSMLSVPNLHVIRPKPACLSDQKRRSNLKKIQMIPRNYNTACTYFLTYHRCIDPHILQIRLFSVLNIHVSGLRTWALAQDISSLAVPPPLTHCSNNSQSLQLAQIRIPSRFWLMSNLRFWNSMHHIVKRDF